MADISLNKIRLLADAKAGSTAGGGPRRTLWVRADSTRIEQVLDNVLSNALKCSPEEQPSNYSMTPQRGRKACSMSMSGFQPRHTPAEKSRISLSGFIRAAQRRGMRRWEADWGWLLRKRLWKPMVDEFGGK